uniref:Uncharacterized protein n=1 Tax=Oryza sativa subsp. japonica TaxID=39947 RepID=Q6K5W8_ORYSJ|nr:hypothetical protein [Oryza sativa Japonica Group]
MSGFQGFSNPFPKFSTIDGVCGIFGIRTQRARIPKYHKDGATRNQGEIDQRVTFLAQGLHEASRIYEKSLIDENPLSNLEDQLSASCLFGSQVNSSLKLRARSEKISSESSFCEDQKIVSVREKSNDGVLKSPINGSVESYKLKVQPSATIRVVLEEASCKVSAESPQSQVDSVVNSTKIANLNSSVQDNSSRTSRSSFGKAKEQKGRIQPVQSCRFDQPVNQSVRSRMWQFNVQISQTADQHQLSF